MSLAPISAFIDEHFDALDELLRGLAAVGEVTPRTTDIVASYGERLSSRIVTAAFLACGIAASHVDARDCIITDAQHMKAIPQDELIAERLREHVLPLAQAGRVPVLGGFIGVNAGGRDHHSGTRRIGLQRCPGRRRAARRVASRSGRTSTAS